MELHRRGVRKTPKGVFVWIGTLAVKQISPTRLLCLIMANRRVKKSPYFGEVLRAYRIERQLTQEQLSERVDVLRTFISSLENGARQPSFEMIFRLAKALDTTPGKLLDPVAEKMEQK